MIGFVPSVLFLRASLTRMQEIEEQKTHTIMHAQNKGEREGLTLLKSKWVITLLKPVQTQSFSCVSLLWIHKFGLNLFRR